MHFTLKVSDLIRSCYSYRERRRPLGRYDRHNGGLPSAISGGRHPLSSLIDRPNHLFPGPAVSCRPRGTFSSLHTVRLS